MLSVASATLAVILCAPTDDPCRIAWTIDTPMFWIACLVDHGRDGGQLVDIVSRLTRLEESRRLTEQFGTPRRP